MKLKTASVLFVLPILYGGAAFASPPAELLVDMVDTTTDEDEAALEALLDGVDLKLNSIHSADERFFVAEIDPSNLARYLELLKDDPRVEHAEPNWLYGLPENEIGSEVRLDDEDEAKRGPLAPNDPMWNHQWNMRMINAPEAWATADGSGVIVAVIDTGVAFEDFGKFRRVEDLAGTEFVTGYNFISDTDHPNDDHGHGTHVAGTIAQTTNNKLGVAGVAPKAKIMPLKVLSRQGYGSAADIADAIRFAADEGAHVINMSLGGGMRSFVMQSAVKYARNKGVVVVCAAGNTGRPKVEFPAAYPGSFAVSSVGPSKKLAFYSSHGKHIAVSAPGGSKQEGGDKGAVLQNTIQPNNLGPSQYLAFQGTSMAAPHVAGVAALVISAGVTDPSQVEKILRESSTTMEGGWNIRYGHGIVNAQSAVKAAKEAKAGLTHYGAALMSFFGLALLGRRRLGSKGIVLAGVAGALLATPLAALDLCAVGPTFSFSALWASALPAFALTVMLVGVKKLRGLLIGLTAGWAAYLAVNAIFMPADVTLIPGIASVIDRIWLALNAGALLLLSAVIARVHTRTR